MALTQKQRKSRWAFSNDTRRTRSTSRTKPVLLRQSYLQAWMNFPATPVNIASRDTFRNLHRTIEIVSFSPLQQDIGFTTEGLRSLFNDLVEVWNEDTMMSSSMREICTHWAYQRVIGLGLAVVPLIMEQIREGDRHWGWALTSITGENPAEHYDSLQEASDAWLQWGAQKGFALV